MIYFDDPVTPVSHECQWCYNVAACRLSYFDNIGGHLARKWYCRYHRDCCVSVLDPYDEEVP